MDIQKEIVKLAEEYRQGIITRDEIQDVLMGIELSQKIDYEELYKIFINETKNDKQL